LSVKRCQVQASATE